jgi:glutamyl-tRNA reductase
LILGEYEILGQVRGALTASSEFHRVQVPLSRLFHGAIRAGRRARDETDIGRNALSISFAGVRLVQRQLGDLGSLNALLIGTGEAGSLVAKALRNSGVGRLTVTNRTEDRSLQLARDLAAETVSFKRLHQSLSSEDIVITAAAVPNLLTKTDISQAMRRRAQKPLFIMDLGMPRNVDPEAAKVSNVQLYNIDSLSAVAEENLQLRKSASKDAARIVEEELSKFMSWWDSQEAVDAVKQLQQRAEDIRLNELERALRKLVDLTPMQRKTVEALTKSLTKKLFHDPSVTLRQPASQQHIKALRDLFKL